LRGSDIDCRNPFLGGEFARSAVTFEFASAGEEVLAFKKPCAPGTRATSPASSGRAERRTALMRTRRFVVKRVTHVAPIPHSRVELRGLLMAETEFSFHKSRVMGDADLHEIRRATEALPEGLCKRKNGACVIEGKKTSTTNEKSVATQLLHSPEERKGKRLKQEGINDASCLRESSLKCGATVVINSLALE